MDKKNDVVAKINKATGKDSASYGSEVSDQPVEVIPTGIMPLDFALGVGGIPRGKITDLFGLPSTGKSSLCLTVIAQAQKMGLQVGYIDTEYSLDLEYARKFGVDTDNMVIVTPDCGEEAFTALETMVNEKFGIVVVDSVSGMVPRAEAEAEFGKPPMGGQARLMSQGLRKMVGPIAKNNTAVIFINQLRQNLMGGTYNPYTSTGGMALRFYASIRLEMTSTGALMSKDKAVGYTMLFRTRKNKVAPVAEKCEVRYFFEGGFEQDGDIIEMAEERGILTRSGNTIFHGETKLGVGKEKAREAIEADHALKQKLISLLFVKP